MKKFLIIIFISATLLSPAVSMADGKIEHPRFMKEYAGYVMDRLDHEAGVRGALRKFLDRHRAELTEGFGYHPELLPEMFRLAGAEKINCMAGKYYEKFLIDLNNEERHAFYETAQAFSWWVFCLAAEEADSMNIKKMSPPISFRQRGDNPFYIKQDLKEELSPYLKYNASGGDGMSFQSIKCDE